MLRTSLAILLASTTIFCSAITFSNAQVKFTTPEKRYSKHEPTNQMLKCILKCAKKYKIKPEILLAVSKEEAQDLEDGLIRIGPIGHGTYYGIMGIFKGFKKAPYYYNLDDPFEVVERGARVLQGNLQKRLRKYNAKYTDRYYRNILHWAQVYEDERVFERSDNKQMFKCTTQEISQIFNKSKHLDYQQL